MQPTVGQARRAGILYLVMGAPAPFVLLYLPSKLIVRGDAAATANNVLNAQTLFMFGLLLELGIAAVFLWLVMALYRLLHGVDKHQARLMVTCVAVSVAVTYANAVTNIAALTLFRGTGYLSVFAKPERDALGMLFLRMHSQGTVVNQIFWGLWLIPFGLLVMRSRFIPRLIGLLLVVNGIAYVVVSSIMLMAPAYGTIAFNSAMPALLGEIWIMLWLLIKGVDTRRLPAVAASA